MPYRVFWQVPQRILCVELEGSLSSDDFMYINQAVNNHLGDDTPDRPVVLLVDATRPNNLPRTFTQLKDSQTYALRRDLKLILVVSDNKFMRLMSLLIFNLCRPSLMFFDNISTALGYLDARLLSTYSS
jgi:hypothetical protein